MMLRLHRALVADFSASFTSAADHGRSYQKETYSGMIQKTQTVNDIEQIQSGTQQSWLEDDLTPSTFQTLGYS